MEKNRGAKIISIVALLVAVLGLSLGFAAFSNTLQIDADVKVKPNSNSFNVDFSASNSSLLATNIIPVKNPEALLATEATIDNTNVPTISNMSATFTEPGQSVTYTFYAYNNGEYDAFLKNITYNNVVDGNSFKICTATPGTTDSLVQSACNSINVKVKVGDEAETRGSIANINSHRLSKNAFEQITVTLEYTLSGVRADGDFSVKFGSISLGYSSVE